MYGYQLQGTRKILNEYLSVYVPADRSITAVVEGEVEVIRSSGSRIKIVITSALDDSGHTKLTYEFTGKATVAKGDRIKHGHVVGKTGKAGESLLSVHLTGSDGQSVNPYFLFVSLSEYEGPYKTAYPTPPIRGEGSIFSPDEFGRLKATAYDQLGKAYVFGATGPDVFDCSGFIYYAYKYSGLFPDLPRYTAQGYSDSCIAISADQAKPGDLIFFAGTYISGISHIGIYLGDGYFIHAVEPVVTITHLYSSDYWIRHFSHFGRF